jgi:3,4-dihydroxy 2-butanone 4-phosphate synthase/GTP cyclohydrolase II
VTLSYAQSLDGSIAERRGRPLILSSPESLRMTHQLRAAHHGILVGVGTVIADDPQLTVRKVNGSNPQPIVLDSQLRTPARARLLQGGRCAPWIVTTLEASMARQQELEQAGAQVIRLPANGDGRVSLAALMPYLVERGIQRLMVEGGAGVITAFITQKLVDHLVVTIAPIFVGGQRSLDQLLIPSPANAKRRSSPSAPQFPSLTDIRYKQLGKDLIVWGTFNWGAS